LIGALKRTQAQIIVFLSFVILVGVVLGSLMYILEVDTPGSSITTMPTGIYWALVTLTTIGYGDITPVTSSGRFLASIVMVLGYGVIAVPGILAVGAFKEIKNGQIKRNTQVCQHCHDSNHMDGSNFCKTCGYPLHRDINRPI